MKQEAKQVIEACCKQFNIELDGILLFGSQARGDAGTQSDWDFLVLTVHEISFPQKRHLSTEIQRRLAALHIPNDIVIKSRKSFENSKTCPGTVSSFAAREGVYV